MSVGAKAAGGAFWNIVTSFTTRVVGMVGTLLLVRYVSPDEYGEAMAAAAIVTTTAQAATLGVGMYVVANRDASRNTIFHASLIHLSLGLLAFAFLVLIGRHLGGFFDAPGFERYVTGLSVAMLLDRVGFMPERVLAREMRFRSMSIVRAAGELGFTVCSLALAYRGWGAASIVWGNLARSAIRGLGSTLLVHWRDWFEVARVRWSMIKELCSYGFSVMMMSFAATASRRWDNLLVSRYFGPGMLGNYNLAYNLADMPAVHVGEQITDVMFAYFARLEGKDRRRVLMKAIGVLALVMFPMSVGLGAIAPTLTTVFLRAEWASVGVMVMILSTMSITRPLSNALGSFVVVERGPTIAAIIEIVHLGVLMAAIASVGRIGPLWTCVTVGVVFAGRTLWVMKVTLDQTGSSARELFSRLWGPLLACLPMAALVLSLPRFLGAYGEAHPVVLLVAQLAAGVVTYPIAALILAPGDSRELISLGRKLLGERRAQR